MQMENVYVPSPARGKDGLPAAVPVLMEAMEDILVHLQTSVADCMTLVPKGPSFDRGIIKKILDDPSPILYPQELHEELKALAGRLQGTAPPFAALSARTRMRKLKFCIFRFVASVRYRLSRPWPQQWREGERIYRSLVLLCLHEMEKMIRSFLDALNDLARSPREWRLKGLTHLEPLAPTQKITALEEELEHWRFEHVDLVSSVVSLFVFFLTLALVLLFIMAVGASVFLFRLLQVLVIAGAFCLFLC